MPSLSDHHGSKFIKLFYIGDSGTGKTGSLVSLVEAGYKLRILDLDNGLDALREFVKLRCPERMGQIDYETRRDRYKASPGGLVINGQPKAFTDSLKLMDKWSDESSPREWGEDTIFVFDSLTAFGKAAFEWAKGMNLGAKDPRQWYFAAQSAVEDTVAMLTGDDFKCNVLVISHVSYNEDADGIRRGYTSAIGSALGPKLPKYLNTLILAERSGTGQNVKRVIRTLPTTLVDLKVPLPNLPGTLPLETGLAEIFKQLKSNS